MPQQQAALPGDKAAYAVDWRCRVRKQVPGRGQPWSNTKQCDKGGRRAVEPENNHPSYRTKALSSRNAAMQIEGNAVPGPISVMVVKPSENAESWRCVAFEGVEDESCWEDHVVDTLENRGRWMLKSRVEASRSM